MIVLRTTRTASLEARAQTKGERTGIRDSTCLQALGDAVGHIGDLGIIAWVFGDREQVLAADIYFQVLDPWAYQGLREVIGKRDILELDITAIEYPATAVDVVLACRAEGRRIGLMLRRPYVENAYVRGVAGVTQSAIGVGKRTGIDLVAVSAVEQHGQAEVAISKVVDPGEGIFRGAVANGQAVAGTDRVGAQRVIIVGVAWFVAIGGGFGGFAFFPGAEELIAVELAERHANLEQG